VFLGVGGNCSIELLQMNGAIANVAKYICCCLVHKKIFAKQRVIKTGKTKDYLIAPLGVGV
jgi:hypothetical protein